MATTIIAIVPQSDFSLTRAHVKITLRPLPEIRMTNSNPSATPTPIDMPRVIPAPIIKIPEISIAIAPQLDSTRRGIRACRLKLHRHGRRGSTQMHQSHVIESFG